MYNVTNAFLRAILADETYSKVEFSLLLPNETTIMLTEQDVIEGTFSITSRIMSGGFEIGTCYASDLSVSLDNLDRRWNGVQLEGATIVPFIHQRIDDGSFESVPLGVFIIDEPGRPYSALNVKASDRAILLDEPFSSIHLAFPATHGQILQAIGTRCNVPIAPSAYLAPNMNRQAPEAPDGDLSCRDIVGELALYAGGFARMNRTGALEIVTIQKPVLNANTYLMPNGSRYDFKQTSDPVTITGLFYGDKLWGSADYAIELADHLALQPESELLASVFAVINGLTYTAFDASYPGNPALDCGDIVQHSTRDGETILSLITAHTYSHRSKSRMQAEAKSKPVLGYKSAYNRRLLQVSARIRKDIERAFTGYEQGTQRLTELLTNSLGIFGPTVIAHEDGSKSFYLHDQPTLEESQTIWKFSGGGYGVSHDGGQTYSAGMTNEDSIIAKIVEAVGVNAEWVHVEGSDKSIGEEFAELRADHLSLQQSLLHPGKNLIENPTFGTVQSPTEESWVPTMGMLHQKLANATMGDIPSGITMKDYLNLEF